MSDKIYVPYNCAIIDYVDTSSISFSVLNYDGWAKFYIECNYTAEYLGESSGKTYKIIDNGGSWVSVTYPYSGSFNNSKLKIYFQDDASTVLYYQPTVIISVTLTTRQYGQVTIPLRFTVNGSSFAPYNKDSLISGSQSYVYFELLSKFPFLVYQNGFSIYSIASFDNSSDNLAYFDPDYSFVYEESIFDWYENSQADSIFDAYDHITLKEIFENIHYTVGSDVISLKENVFYGNIVHGSDYLSLEESIKLFSPVSKSDVVSLKENKRYASGSELWSYEVFIEKIEGETIK